MAFKYNPLSGQIEDQQQGPQGPAGTVSSVGGGTAGTPGFNFNGDTDTGIYSAGVNTLGIATGGTQKVLINGDGELGIGTPDPFGPFHVRLAEDKNIYFTTSVESVSTISTVNDGGTAFPPLAFKSSDVYFANAGSNVLRIDTSGKVGIGTDTPNATLHIQNNTEPTLNNNTHTGETLFLRSGGVSGVDNVQAVLAFGKADSSSLRTGSAIASVQTDSDTDKIGIGFYTSPSSTSTQTLQQKLLIDHNGNVGIGTNAPSKKLDVVGTDSVLIKAKRNNTGNASGGVEIGNNDRTWTLFGDNDYFTLYDNGSSSSPLVVKSDGNVGIGNSNPTNSLSILGSVNDAGIDLSSNGAHALRFKIDSNQSSAHDTIFFQSARWNGTEVASIHMRAGTDTSNKDDGSLTFHTANGAGCQERVRIDSSGNVGIGNDSPYSNTSYNSLTIGKTKKGLIELKDDNDAAKAHIYTDSGDFKISTVGSAGSIKLITGNTATRLTIDSNGNVGIGHTEPTSKLYVNGTQNGLQARFGGVGTGLGISLGQKTNNNALVSFLAQDSTYGTFRFVKGTSTEQLRIDSDGKVLIGSTSANNYRLGNKLIVADTAAYTGMSISQYAGNTAAEKPMLDFNRSGGSSDGSLTAVGSSAGLGEIVFRGADGNSFEDGAAIRAFADGTIANGQMPGKLTFHTSSASGTELTNRLTIDSSGKVGIGTDSPSAPLEIETTNPSIKLTDTNGSITSIFAPSNDNFASIGTESSHSFRIFTNGQNNPKLAVQSDGKVGIGTTTPNEILQINQAGAVQTIIGSTNGGGAWLILDGDSNGDGIGSDYSSIVHNSDGLVLTNRKTTPIVFKNMIGGSETEALRISDGDTKLPDDKYLKFGASNDLTIRHASGNNYINSQNGSLYIQAGGDSALEIKSDENVRVVNTLKIGDDSGPSTNYSDIFHNDESTAYGFTFEYSNATAIINRQGNNEEALVLGDTSPTNAHTLFGISVTTDAWSTVNTRFSVAGNGDVITTGNIKMAATKGIQFSNYGAEEDPDNAATDVTSNTLDDYEEGTFNPQLGGADNHDTYAISGGATYTKIGRKVYMQISFQSSDLNNSADGQVLIKNLPFTFLDTTVNSSHTAAGISCDFATTNVTLPHSGDMNRYVWQLIGSAGQIKGYIVTDGGSMTDWDAGSFTAYAMELRLNITGITAT